eukprot:scaffold232072_cov50-Attheya_sp.AAC.2
MGAAELLPSDPTYYYARVVLTVEAWKDLDWWEQALNEPDFSAQQHNVLATLIATWGDGSGMGTGGTLQTHSTTGSSSKMEMWMGVWSHAVHSSTSNWKELRTLLETLRREQHLGTDGLSRGFWIAPHQARLSPSAKTARVFRGALPTPLVVTWLKAIVCCDHLDMTHQWLILTDTASWAPGECLGRSVLGFPPPHLARQMMTQEVLLAWAEFPLTTSALFLIPQVFQ